MSHIQTQRIAGKAIIESGDGKVLILREASTYVEGTNVGKYHLPGGRIEVGEPFFEGLKREVREETGLEIEVEKPIFVSEWFPVIKGVPNQIIGVFFSCKPSATSQVALSDEHDEAVWVDPIDLSGHDLLPAERQALEAWMKAKLVA